MRTLVDLIQRDINRTDTRTSPERNPGLDWPRVVEDAVLRQDMEWLYAADLGDRAADPGRGTADEGDRLVLGLLPRL